MTALLDDVRMFVDAESASNQAIQNGVISAVNLTVSQVDNWFSQPEVVAMGREISALVDSGVRSTASTTDGYLANVASAMLGSRVSPSGLLVERSLRAGTSTFLSYLRLGAQYRYEIMLGVSAAIALGKVVHRATKMVETDMRLAHREQARRFMTVNRVDGYRRVVHPELAKKGSCGLCWAAADQIYSRDDLLPIHTGCSCTVTPIINGKDPGSPLNRADLVNLYSQAGDSSLGVDLSQQQYKVIEHGEFGPILANRRHRIRTPRNMPKNYQKNYHSELATLEKSYRDLQIRQLAGEDVSRPMQYHETRLSKLRAQIAEEEAAAAA